MTRWKIAIAFAHWRLGNKMVGRLQELSPTKFRRRQVLHSSPSTFETNPRRHFFTMIKRVLSRQSRSLVTHVPSRPISQLQTPLRLRNLQPLASTFAKPFPPRLGARWQSTETDAEAKTNPEPGPVPSEEAKTAEAENPIKKELEAKNREVIDLKVRHTSIS